MMKSIIFALLLCGNVLAITLIYTYRLEAKKFFDTYAKVMIWIVLTVCTILVSSLIYETRVMIREFFAAYKDVFTGVGYTAVSIGLIFTGVQIRGARNKARANFSYFLFKDGREIVKSIEKKVLEIMKSEFARDIYNEDQLFKANAKIEELIKFYACAFQQWSYGNVEEHEWNDVLDELCEFLVNYPLAKEFWDDRIADNTLWDKKFRKLVKQCLKRKGDQK